MLEDVEVDVREGADVAPLGGEGLVKAAYPDMRRGAGGLVPGGGERNGEDAGRCQVVPPNPIRSR